MSGQATGWVLRNGPSPGDGISAPTARRWRAVLHTIADAANRDGEHAHPGLQAMIEGSLYSRAQVLKTVRELEEAGWIETVEPAAPGRATTFRLPPMAPANGSRSETRPKRNGSQNHADGSHLGRSAPITANNGVTNGPSDAEASGTDDDPPTAIVRAAWDRLDPKPATPWPGMVKIARKLLAAGWSAKAIEDAFVEAPTVSTGAVEMVLRKRRGRRPRQERNIDRDRSARSGRVDSL